MAANVRYKKCCVRDLAWVISSPPLLLVQDDDVS